MAAPSLLLAASPESTLLVVNADSWASRSVANEYVRLRGIPAQNVVHLHSLPGFEGVDVEAFREKILKPVLEAIETRDLKGQIDCIAYSADLPYAVSVRKDVGKRKLPKFFTPTASINGLTYLYEDVLKKDPSYLRLDRNRYARRRLKALEARQPTDEERARHNEALRLLMEKKPAQAEPILQQLARQDPKSARVQYNLACCLARQNKPEEALAALRRAMDNGWMNYRFAKKDKDFACLRDREDFQSLLDSMRNAVFEIQPTCAFRSTCGWSEKGEAVESGGRRYMLAMMLAMTSGRGNSVREAVDALRRSASADGTCPKGTIYYVVNEDIRSATRDWSFHCAVQKLEALGVEAEIVKGVLPENKPDVQGAMVGKARFSWESCGSTILPGAICEHLTSAGGVIRERSIQTPLSEFIRYGAAAAIGTVTEPYAILAKFPDAFVHVHYAHGCTLVEAFYQSLRGPYQLLIVGDPLCRPWARIPEVIVRGMDLGATLKGKVSIHPDVKDATRTPVARYELFADGRRIATGKPGAALEWDTTQYGDGYHELRVVAVAADPTETTGRLIAPVETSNGQERRVEISAPSSATVRWGQALRLRAKAPGAKEIRFRHNGGIVGRIQGSERGAAIDARRLGLGPVAIQAVAVFGDDPTRDLSLSRPIQLTVEPPPALPALKLGATTKLAEGLELIRPTGKRIVVYDTYPDRWLRGFVKPGEAVELAGYFDVPTDDMYQFQVRSSFPVRLEVDGKALEGEAMGESTPCWIFYPVALAGGTHKLRVRGTVTASPRLDIRFGGPGAFHLSGARFRRPTKQ